MHARRRRRRRNMNKINGGFGPFLPGSLAMYFSYLGVEKHWSRIAKCLGRLRSRALGSLAGFRMYAHYANVGANPT